MWVKWAALNTSLPNRIQENGAHSFSSLNSLNGNNFIYKEKESAPEKENVFMKSSRASRREQNEAR